VIWFQRCGFEDFKRILDDRHEFLAFAERSTVKGAHLGECCNEIILTEPTFVSPTELGEQSLDRCCLQMSFSKGEQLSPTSESTGFGGMPAEGG